MKFIRHLFLFLFFCIPCGFAQTYEELAQAIRAAKEPSLPTPEFSARQMQVRTAWYIGKLIDDYLLENSARATVSINQLAADLKEDPSRLYYDLQFARTYPEEPPTLDLHWGFYQYLLAVNDPKERESLAERAVKEKWDWDTLRAEVKLANRDNQEFVFTNAPGKTGVYRAVKIKYGNDIGKLALDTGFGTYQLISDPQIKEYNIVPPSGRDTDLFTYKATVIHVMDGDTFQAFLEGEGSLKIRQGFRLWGLDAPEIYTKEGRQTKKVLEEFVLNKTVLIRALYMEKYGRYLADVWSYSADKKQYIYVNQYLTDRGLAEPQKRQVH